GLECRRQRHARGIGTATPQGGDVALIVDALETGHHNHAPRFQIATDVLCVDLQDPRLAVGTVGVDTYLIARVGNVGHADLDQGHGQQGDGHLIARRDHNVQLTRHRLITDLPGEIDQAIGLSAHGRNLHYDIVTVIAEFLDLCRNL